MNWLKERKARKTAREILRRAKHFRNMREDLLSDRELGELAELESSVMNALRTGDMRQIEESSEKLYERLLRIAPARPLEGLREHVEILTVAIAVAMGIRSYFLQPFKIPTGSMQTTLYGITSTEMDERGWSDRQPVSPLKWLVFGEWFKQVTIRKAGMLDVATQDQAGEQGQFQRCYRVGNSRYFVPRDARKLNYEPGNHVPAGSTLWSGIVRAGDHVFVDKLTWNFRKPKRGEIVVFATDGIWSLPQQTHYIKRLIGFPGETVSIKTPNVVINGLPVTEPQSIRRISSGEYGYTPAGSDSAKYIRTEADAYPLGPGEYFVLGDNTRSSRDSRYWGPVPEPNIVGRALLVYWPASPRWGLTR